MSGRRLLVAMGGALFLVLLVRTAWLSDTSYLTIRTAENASRGLCLCWNPVERVQVFTHPLWLVLLTAGRAATGEAYFTTLILSIICSLATVVLLLSAAATETGTVVAAAVLALSWSFLTYSTSGLEAPVAHLLVAAFAIVWLEDVGAGRDRRAATVAGLATVTHVSTLFITAPPLFRSLRAA